MKILKDGAKILPKVGFHLWQFFFSRGGLPWCKDGAKGGLIASRTGRTAKGGLFSFGGLITAKGRLISAKGGLFLSDWLQRWASSFQRWAFPEYRPKVGFSSIFGQRWAYSAGSDPLQPRRYSELPKVGFHLPGLAELPKVGFSFDGAKILPEVGLIQPYKPLFGQRWASIFGRWAFPCLTAKGRLKRLIFALFWAYFGLIWSFSPLVGFSCCLYTL